MMGTFRALPSGEQQGLALFLTHGVADAATTALAASALGPAAESNPIMQAALEQGIGFGVGIMLLVVGAIAVAYPTLAEMGDIPEWFGWLVAAVGACIAALNLVVVLL